MKQRKLVAVFAVLMIVVLCVGLFAACNKDNDTGADVYSYRLGPADLPTSWNFHTYQSNSSTYVLDYTTDALYVFDYNDTKTGYVIVPSMASEYPVDVTSQYVGQYGIVAGDSNKAYSISLKTNLTFDNGDAINANTFVESMKLLLNPEAKNFRADNVYQSGNLKIYNAENYVKQNSYGTNGNIVSENYGDDEYVFPEDFTWSTEGILQINGQDVVIDINNGGNWGDDGLATYFAKGYLTTSLTMDNETGRVKIFDATGENWILTRSVGQEVLNPEAPEEEQTKDYIFYDLQGNRLVQRTVNEEGTAWVYFDKDGEIVEEWAGCKPEYRSSCYEPLAEAADANGIVKLNERLLRNVQDCIAMLHGFADVEEYAAPKGEYSDLLVAYYNKLYTENSEALIGAWDGLSQEQKDQLVDVTYKTYDVENSVWIDKTGVSSGEEYAQYRVYAVAVDSATEDSQPNSYAYVEFEEMAFYGKQYGELEYEGNVGFFAKDDYTLVIVLKNAMEDNFYLRYELCSSFFLVHPTLYRNCISTSSGVYTNSYGTSVATYIGYGPYKLTKYVADNSIILERNDKWHGYSQDEYVEGTYQTDRIVYTCVKDDATRLEMFLKGELDSYGLQANDISDYINSDYIYYTDSESTWYLAMNPDFDNLESVQKIASSTTGKTVVKTVLSIQEFRQALSYSLNREQFNLRFSPTSGVAKELLSAMIVADPDSGKTYRSLDEAKDAILNFWGLSDEWGEGKEYATRDEAIASITGYDPEGAKALFTAAYEKAVEQGMITQEQVASGNWIVQIVIGIPAKVSFYTDGAEFLATNWANAVAGTPFEGHIECVQSEELGSTSFGEYLRTGKVDILFGVGYGGSMFNPYSMMDCFTGSLQYDPFTDKTAVDMDVTFDFGNGVKTYRASLYDWVSVALQGDTITITEVDSEGNPTSNTMQISAGSSDPAERRIAILAASETKIMTLSNIFPLMTDATASLKGMRIQYATEDYVVGMARGGIQYYTYAMSDAKWAEYVASQPNGQLNYK